MPTKETLGMFVQSVNPKKIVHGYVGVMQIPSGGTSVAKLKDVIVGQTIPLEEAQASHYFFLEPATVDVEIQKLSKICDYILNNKSIPTFGCPFCENDMALHVHVSKMQHKPDCVYKLAQELGKNLF